jgi:hypothetical protein
MKASKVGIWAAVLVLAACSVVFAKSHSGKAFLGITPGEVTSDISSDYGVEAGKGVLVEGVVGDSPAEKAGLRENDIITQLGVATLTGPEELRVQLAKYKPDDKVNITYLRGGKSKTIEIELAGTKEHTFNFNFGGDNDSHNFIWGKSKNHKSEKVGFAGIVTQDLSEGLSSFFKVKKGALISEVVKDSPAEHAGLKAGDVIVKIGSEDIEDVGDVRDAIHEHKKGDVVDFDIYRDGVEQHISVTLDERSSDFGMLEGKIDLGDLPDCDGMMMDLRNGQCAGNGVQILKDGDLKDLENDLKDLQIELKTIPSDANIKSISNLTNSSDWNTQWERAKDQLKEEMDLLRSEFEQLKDRMHDLKTELAKRMS